MGFRPTLPPRSGYVEVEIDGERVYRNIKTRAIVHPGESDPPEYTAAEQDIADLLVDQEYRLTVLELGVAEEGISNAVSSV